VLNQRNHLFNEHWEIDLRWIDLNDTFTIYNSYKMIFLFILTLLIGSQALFSLHLFQEQTLFSILLASVQLLVFTSSLLIMMRTFRRSRTTNYKKGFYAFGAMIATGIPTVGYFIFGLAYLVTGFVVLEYIGWGIAGSMFIAILVGIFWGRWNWITRTIELEFEHLPEELDGTRIVQISDVHVGSFFNNYPKVQKAIDQMNGLDADYVFFTGDLVNNIEAEMHGWEPVFRQIKAKKGKYSILGNHDYGDYVPWEEKELKKKNIEALVEMHRSIGFTPLLNDRIQISSQEHGAWIIGVENWGTAPFRQSGDLAKSTEDIPADAFRILLSHDPSHFDEQVVGTGIDLTLSGHTHGMQFGIERFGIKFSPVQFRYKKWAGLYQIGKQFLYVNRGFGYLGFPGRVGIYPEITLIILKKKR